MATLLEKLTPSEDGQLDLIGIEELATVVSRFAGEPLSAVGVSVAADGDEVQVTGDLSLLGGTGAFSLSAVERAEDADPESAVAWEFEYTAEPGAVSLVGGLQALAGQVGFDFVPPTPAGLDLTDISLTSFRMVFDPAEAEVFLIALDIALVDKWSFGSLIEISNVVIECEILSPLDSALRTIATSVRGSIASEEVGNAVIDLVARHDEGFSLEGRLRSGTKIGLSNLVSRLVAVPDLPNVTVRELFFRADSDAEFLIETTLEHGWELSLGSETWLTLKETMFRFERTSDGIDASCFGLLELGESAGDITLSGEYQSGQGWAFEGHAFQHNDISLTDLAGQAVTAFGGTMPPQVPDLRIRDVRVRVESATKAVEFEGRSTTKTELPIGGLDFELETHVRLRSERDVQARKRRLSAFVSAELEIADSMVFDVEFNMGGTGRSVSASWRANEGVPLSVNTLLDAIGIDAVELPDAINPELTAVRFVFNVATKSISLTAESANFGRVFLISRRGADGKWAHMFCLEFPENLRLSDLPEIGDELAVADFLTFKKMAIIISTREMKGSTLPQLPRLTGANGSSDSEAVTFLESRPMNLVQGLNFAALIELNGNVALDNLRQATGMGQLCIQAGIGKGALRFRAGLDGEIAFKVGSDTLAFSDAFVQLDIMPLALQLGGTVALKMNDRILRARGALAISTTEASAMLEVSADSGQGAGSGNLLEPLGITGLKLNSIGVIVGATFAPAGVKFGMQAKFQIGEQQPGANEMAMVLQVIPAAPAPVVNIQLMAFALDELDIPTMLIVFTNGPPPALPDELTAIRATDLGFFFCQTPTVLPDGSSTMPGFGFNGNVDLFGFRVRARLKIDSRTGIEGAFQMSPVDIKVGGTRILQISGNGQEISETGRMINGQFVPISNDQALLSSDETPAGELTKRIIVDAGGPVFEFSTSGPRFLYASIYIDIFDLVRTEVEAEIATSGIKFIASTSVSDIVKAELSCIVNTTDNPGLTAHASIDIDLDVDIDFPPIGELDLGSFHLDTELHASLDLTATARDGFALAIEGSFRFEGVELDLPKLEVRIPIATLRELPEKILEHLKNEAEEIFTGFFSDVEELWNDVQEEIVKIAAEAEEFFEDVGEEAERIAGEIQEQAEEVLQRAAEAAEQLVDEIEDVGQQALDVAQQAVEEVAVIQREVAREVERIAAEAEAFVEDIAEDIQTIAHEAEVFVNNIGQEIEQITRDVERELTEFAQEAEREVTRVLREADEFVQGVLREAESLVKDLEAEAEKLAREAEKVLKEIERLLEQAGEAIVDAAEDAGEFFVETAEDAGEFFEDVGGGFVSLFG